VSDRPKTMRERTVLKVVAGKIIREGAAVSQGEGQEFDPSTVWTGTTLSTALVKARVAEAVQAADGAQVVGRGEPDAEQIAEAAVPKPRAKPSAPPSRAKHAFTATRSVARKLALQALYRGQLNDGPWQDLVQEIGEAEDMANADRGYFRELVEGVWASRQSLDGTLAELMDRPVVQLDPVEHAVLLIGLYELTARPEVPYRVAINESVGLAKRFGATDGHKFVNAVLDRAARKLRPNES